MKKSNLLKHFAFFIIIFIGSTLYLNSQTIIIDSTFTSDTEIFPFSSGTNIYGLSVSGEVTLNSDTSLVRLILIDSSFNELLLYEAYPMISNGLNYSFSNKSDETTYLDETKPYSIEIQLIDANIKITSLNTSLTLNPNYSIDQKAAKNAVEVLKVNKISTFIESRKMVWFADTNEFSQLSYAEKKKILGNKYNLSGFDYYKSGVYDLTFGNMSQTSQSDLVDEFSWMNRHGYLIDNGLNNDGVQDPYLDLDDGWLTPFSQPQDCGHCTIFATVNVVEAMTNIYFNNNLDIDLSEQQIASCIDSEDDCRGFYPPDPFNFFKDYGVVNEMCFEYVGDTEDDIPCPVCNDPIEEIQISKVTTPLSSITDENIKKGILMYGPSALTVKAWNHRMMFYGFGSIKYKDKIYEDNQNQSHIIDDPNDPLIGQNYWLVKNSWVINWGEGGFAKIFAPCNGVTTENKLKNFYYLEDEIYSNIVTRTVNYYDYDNDGYYNWGIGTRPDDCPDTEKDSDDSNPRIGPFDENYYGVAVTPNMVVTDDNLQTVNQYAYYNFYDAGLQQDDQIVLNFTIHNYGNAQLNLMDNTFGGAFILEQEGNNYEIDATGFDNIIQKNGSTNFSVVFTLKSQISETKIAKLTLVNNEADIENYVFYLAFADCNSTGEPEHIGLDTDWDIMQVIDHDVYVSNGAILNITSDIGFTHNANLYIESGKFDKDGSQTEAAGKVYVNGGNLSALCDSWSGVDVWGISEVELSNGKIQKIDQYTSGNQGAIKLMNGGKISYAQNAIETIMYDSRGSTDPNTAGGIAIISDGEIYNCTNGVILYPYENHHPVTGNILSNASYFTRAHFYNDKNALCENQLVLDEVDGISIKGCTFENQNNATGGFTPPSYGLRSYNSSFNVGNYEPSSGDTIQTKFTKHNYGIYASSSGRYLSEIIRINSTYFDNNKTGIYMSAIDKPQITRNEFLIKDKYAKFLGNESIGLYIDTYSTAFTVEENNFYSLLSLGNIETEKCNGITVNNLGEEYNEIYNNTFDKLTVGIAAAGTNRDETSNVGLCIECNDFKNSINDIYVTTSDSPVGSKQGIAYKQGDEAPWPGEDVTYNPTYAAGNTFSKEIAGLTGYNYYNEDPDPNDQNKEYCEPIVYTYHGMPSKYKVKPEPIYPPALSNHLKIKADPNAGYESKEAACPSNLIGGGIEILAMSNLLENSSEAVIAYSDTLDMYVDGGNTTSLNLEVTTSLPDESLELRQQLLNESPYLSDTVMKSAALKENVLTNAMVRDVMVANPQSAKSPGVIQSIIQRETEMPDYMMEEIEEGAGIMGGKDILTNNMAQNKRIRDKAFHNLLLHYMLDTSNISASLDSIKSILQNCQYPEPHYSLAMLYIREGDSVSAFNTLNDIEYKFELSEKEEFAHELFVDLAEQQWQIKTDTTIADSIHIEALIDISENFNTVAGIYARNMLISLGETEYQEPYYFPVLLKTKPIFGYNRNKARQRASLLKIFPNPARDYFTAETKIDNDFTSAKLTLINLEGKEIKSFDLQKKRNQIILTTESIISGTYLLKLIVNGNLLDSKKVIILK